MKLVIAEKPSVGAAIAAVLCANEKRSGYFEGSGYLVSTGHKVGGRIMLRFMIKLPFRIIAAPVWLVLAAVNIVLVFLVGLSAGFCYLIAGISVVTEVLSIGFGISTDWTMKSAILTTGVFVLLPHIGMGIVAVIEVVKCGLQDFTFG